MLTEGRDGTRAVYSDGTAPKILPAVNWPWHPQRLAPPRGDSRYGLHVTGGKMTTWGAVLTVDFAGGACYDVSAYGGFEFWAKGANTRVHASVSVIDSVLVEKGGTCIGDCPPNAAKPVDLVKDWTRYRVSWQELQDRTANPSGAFDPKRAVTLGFSFYSQDTPFDAWIDDIRFTERP